MAISRQIMITAIQAGTCCRPTSGYQPAGEIKNTRRSGTRKIRTNVILLGQLSWLERGGGVSDCCRAIGTHRECAMSTGHTSARYLSTVYCHWQCDSDRFFPVMGQEQRYRESGHVPHSAASLDRGGSRRIVGQPLRRHCRLPAHGASHLETGARGHVSIEYRLQYWRADRRG